MAHKLRLLCCVFGLHRWGYLWHGPTTYRTCQTCGEQHHRDFGQLGFIGYSHRDGA